MKKILFCLLLLSLVGCSVKTLRSPITKNPASIRVTVSGLQSHIIYPNDMVWLNIYDGMTRYDDKLISRERLTIGSPLQNYKLDGGQSYLFLFSSVQPGLGGFKSCTVQKSITPAKNEKIQLNYKIINSRCTVALQ